MRTSSATGVSTVDMPERQSLAPAWGWRGPGAGRVANVHAGVEYQGTTVQICGLFPFVAGSGAPPVGVPIGRHMLWGEVVCLDPLEWLRAGLVTNPGMFLLGQPGVGKSSLAKRLITGLTGYGTQALVLADQLRVGHGRRRLQDPHPAQPAALGGDGHRQPA